MDLVLASALSWDLVTTPMKPIRFETQQDTVQDPWNGLCRPAGGSATFHVLSASGGLESQTERRVVAADCGCLKPPAGFCAVCGDGSTACVDCFGFCHQCRKPICPRHSVFGPSSVPNLRLCHDCHGTRRRSNIVRGIVRFLLAPFVSFGNARSHGSK